MQAPGSCNGVVRRVLFLQRAAAACALADGPGAPSVEGTILRALRATCRSNKAATLCCADVRECVQSMQRHHCAVHADLCGSSFFNTSCTSC